MKLLKLLFVPFVFIFVSCEKESELQKASNLNYGIDTITLLVGEEFESIAPIIEGDGEFVFGFANVSSNNTEGLKIDAETGVISITTIYTNTARANSIPDILVTNPTASVIFKETFS